MLRSASLAFVLSLWAPLAAAVEIVDAFPNLTFGIPVDIQTARDGSNRLFVVDQPGRIWVFDNHPDATTKKAFLDIRDRVDDSAGEEGLLGLAFHPEYPDSPYCYVNYTANSPNRTVISRFTTSADPDSADENSEFVLMEIEKPAANHNAGALAFGKDDYLYLTTGDGGTGGAPAQDLTSLLGSVLRIDVDARGGMLNYAIPTDNPYVGNVSGYREEIWAYGFRNPWRLSIDASTGQVWVGDVGQDNHEEVDTVSVEGNYGWNIMEGPVCWPGGPCDTTGKILPVWFYEHGCCGKSITGGYVYRGVLLLDWIGKYVYADFLTGEIWTIELADTGTVNTFIADTPHNISSFGVDEGNNLFFCSYSQGRVYRFLPTVTSVDGSPPPSRAALGQNFPNPFNPRTVIEFLIDEPAYVEILIYDVRGTRVHTLVRQRLGAGSHVVHWEGRDAKGRELSSGVYYYALRVGERTIGTRRMVLLK